MLDHAEALKRCAAGDQAALRALFSEEAGRMIGIAMRILRRRDLAEEAVQDAFVLIWRKAHTYIPERGSARGWIYTIVRNRALNILRDARRETPTLPEDIDTLREADPVAATWEGLDEASRLRGCLSALDEVKRRCILMAYVMGYSHGEIAGRLDAPLGTVKAWVRRGLIALRECLG
ncbi:sigma-70 family RNA polymerase sigma factor [Paroceanicella profunda]|uniref:Sigma-70 family RNA polymerase sigma factor n=1 Tax=Paroceanicella profunda TaxID=2579971 RepID=A0A5B8FS31_9RHOB|nr:sigma-70 family RNA polymerase sigma factor [Paroceanicella profunda]QDL91576.1 sigma-70 family RNA polymerase sigma factor [Paroceanicella profunda]